MSVMGKEVIDITDSLDELGNTTAAIGKGFAIGAVVVLPSSSNESVISLTSLPIQDISAIPPALSATGPYASIAMVIPTVESIPTAAIPTP